MSENIKLNAWEAAEEIVNLRRENAALRKAKDMVELERCEMMRTMSLMQNYFEQLRADKERLDFLGKTKCAYYYEGPCCWRINEDKATDSQSLRAAIDAARKEKP